MSAPIRKGLNARVDVEIIHDNTSQEIIVTTSDKLNLVLIEHLNKVETSKSWQTPFSMTLTIALVFCSADFKSSFGLSADTWHAIFIIALAASIIWLIFNIIRYAQSPSLSMIIKKIKKLE